MSTPIPNDAEQPEPLELKNPARAALLAWLVPGLGHLYQGRTKKGVLFMASIVGLFIAGMAIGGGRVAYASTLPFSPLRSYVYDGWPFLCQSGIGVVALPGWIERARYRSDSEPMFGGWFYPPISGERVEQAPPITTTDAAGNTVDHADEAAKWRYDLGFRFEVGMVYTVIAGLLNILVVYDAHSGPLVVIDPKKRRAPEPAPTS